MIKRIKNIFILVVFICTISTFATSCNTQVNTPQINVPKYIAEVIKDETEETTTDIDEEIVEKTEENVTETEFTEENKEEITQSEMYDGYNIIEVDGGDTSGVREPSVAVNIGFGDREYWAFTNEYGQLIRVMADEIVLQDDNTEPVNSNGRYYSKMADVPGVGAKYGYDRGHVIADSLGGVANAYNITPQDATLNRHGDQAYMEKNIRDAGGCTDFEAIITYPDTKTQIPSKYKFIYTLKGSVIVDEFENKNPEE